MADERYWNKIAQDYHGHILGPFAPEMTIPDANGRARNLLLNKLQDIAPYLKDKRIADVGCGPGNLIPHIADKIDELTGIDISSEALAHAGDRAQRMGMRFHPVKADIARHEPTEAYDIIISVNSILPPQRSEVNLMLNGIRHCMSHHGELWAIMPSFDTIDHLLNCMREDLAYRYNENEAERQIQAFKDQHKYNAEHLSYSDDSVEEQCFHTPESIARDFQRAGLAITEGPEKVYYPWSLTAGHDYGNYPGKEEIWDWFVVAKPDT